MDAIPDLFKRLESNNPQVAEEARNKFREHFNSTKDSWLLNGIFDYYVNTGSLRSIDVMVSVKEPHERYLFDRLSETLRTSQKLHALTLLGHVVQRNPSWLYKITQHGLFKDLLRLLKAEKDVLTIISALLIVIILLPIIACLVHPYLQELFEIFSHLASWKTNNQNKVPDSQLLHLQVGLWALFKYLYGMFPCNLIHFLRSQYSSKENLAVFSHTIMPMLYSVKMHPLLVTASKDTEISPARWKKMEVHDVIMECAKFSVDPTSIDRQRDDCSFRLRTASFRSKPNLDFSCGVRVHAGETDRVPAVASFSTHLPCQEFWSPSVFTDSVTPPEVTPLMHTPSTQAFIMSTSAYSPEGNSPPEAAIEATPESTPVKDLRQSLPLGRSSSVVRLFHAQSQPSSPMKKDSSPFKFPSHSQTPVSASGISQDLTTLSQQQPSIRSSAPMVQRIQKITQERVQSQQFASVLTDEEQIRAKGVVYTPGSPLRLITASPLDRSSSVCSPHQPDRSEEDREVETTLRTSASQIVQPASHTQLKRMESLKNDEDEDLEECSVERKGCLEGGLHVPDSRSMDQFKRRVNRLRFRSQCQPDSFQLPHLNVGGSTKASDAELFEDVTVRRVVSCPEMKIAPLCMVAKVTEKGASPFQESEEEEEPSNKMNSRAFISCCTQTEDLQPSTYEHLFLSIFPPWEQIQQRSAPPNVTTAPSFQEPVFSPGTALESYIAAALRGLAERKHTFEFNEVKMLKEQLELLMHQLQFEKHRREVHAERNRRLLGKSRAQRALKEHNSALRDQVIVMQKEIETLRLELLKMKSDNKKGCDQLCQNLNYWKDQNNSVQKRCKDNEGVNSLLKKELEDQKKMLTALSQKHALACSKMFDSDNALQDAITAVSSSKELKSQIDMLQHHLTAAGELELRLRSRLNTLNVHCNKDMESLMSNIAYSYSLSALKSELRRRNASLATIKCRLNDLESAVRRESDKCREKDNIVQSVRDEHSRKSVEMRGKMAHIESAFLAKEEELLKLQAELNSLKFKGKEYALTVGGCHTSDAGIGIKAEGTSSPHAPPSPSTFAILSKSEAPTSVQNLHLLVESTTSERTLSKDSAGPP